MFENEVFGHMVIAVDPVKSGNRGFVGLKLGVLRGVKSNKVFWGPDFSLVFSRLEGISVSGKGVVFEVEPVFILSNIVEVTGDQNQKGVAVQVGPKFVEHFTAFIFVGGIIINDTYLEVTVGPERKHGDVPGNDLVEDVRRLSREVCREEFS